MSKKNKKLSSIHLDITSWLLGLSLLIVVLFNWKNFFMPLRLSIIGFGILLLFFYKPFINRIKTTLGVFGEIFIVIFPVLINAILFYLFYKYKIRFDFHWFVFIWLAGIMPLAYNYASKSVSIISYILFLAWSVMIFNLDITVFDIRLFAGTILKLLLLLCFCGLTFGLADLVASNKKLQTIGQIWKILSIVVGSIVLLMLTIGIFDNFNFFDIGVYAYNAFYAHGLFLILFFITTLGILLYNFIYKSIRFNQFNLENFTALLFIFIPTSAYILVDNYFVTHPPYFYSLVYDQSIGFLFNSVFICFALVLLWFGIATKSRWIWQFGVLTLTLFALSKIFSDYLVILKI